jgi:hypothetical protein
MKIRTGFVSNSSSSSFICGICGEVQSGWDLSLSDAEMVECSKHGHIFCESHIKKELKEDFDEEVDRYDTPEKYCPLCCLEEISDEDSISYIFKKFKIDKKIILKEINESFSNYKDFKNSIK